MAPIEPLMGSVDEEAKVQVLGDDDVAQMLAEDSDRDLDTHENAERE